MGLGSRPQALTVPSRRAECKLFLLLSSEHAARAIDDIETLCRRDPCVFDKATKNLLGAFDIRSVEFRMYLAAIALEIKSNTSSTEHLHSRHLQRTKGRIHSHRMHLCDVGTLHIPANTGAGTWGGYLNEALQKVKMGNDEDGQVLYRGPPRNCCAIVFDPGQPLSPGNYPASYGIALLLLCLNTCNESMS